MQMGYQSLHLELNRLSVDHFMRDSNYYLNMAEQKVKKHLMTGILEESD